MPELRLAGSDDGPARCIHCGVLAVGPCARCDAPLCGDCCVIIDGGAKPYAVCRGCRGDVGASLRGRWLGVLAWIAVPIVVLAVAVVVMALLTGP